MKIKKLKAIGYAILHPADSQGYFAETKKDAMEIRERMVVTIIRSFHLCKFSQSDQRRLRRNILIRRLKKVA